MMSLINLLLDICFYVTMTRIFLHNLKLWCLGCTVNWSSEANTHVEGGILRSNVTTVEECKQECLSTVNCTGLDWPDVGECWLTVEPWATNKKQRQNITHYTLNPTCPRTYTQNVILV